MPTTSHSLLRPISKTAETNYLLHIPNSDIPTTKYPLILHLHGAGERGRNLELVRNFGLSRICQRDPAFPFIVASPQCPENDFWRTDVLFALLDELCEKYPIDPERIYVSGASMGGYGTWALAAHDPSRFAAIAPICGRAAGLWTWALTKLPIWVFHGALDPVVPLDESARLVKDLQALGNPVKFTIYPTALHDCWTRTYRNPELYTWFMTHKRSVQSK